MKTKFIWSKKLFSQTYNIYTENKLTGQLTNKSFSKNSIGKIDGKTYSFQTKGIFNQKTKIIDNFDNTEIGEIIYNGWKTKATINILNQTLNWQYSNAWNSKWSVSDDKGTFIKYSGSTTGGTVDSNSENELYVLCGLFVTNYYWQTTVAVMIAIFLPIYISILH